MKKILYILTIIFVSFTLISCNKKTTNTSISIAMLSGSADIDDKSFYQVTWEGILKYAKDNNLPKKSYTYKNSPNNENHIINLSIFADNHPDLIIAPGFHFAKALNKVAPKYPKQKFLLLDSIYKPNQNVASITFASNEGSFLVGICAALKANELNLTKVGFLGGADVSVVREFEAGFIAGVKTINPNINIITRFAKNFANPSLGQKIASQMYDQGVNIIFNVAGSTGNGLIKEAKKRRKLGQEAWVIGVDKDQYEEGIYKDKKSIILTSMIKKLDVATYNTLELVKQGKFKGIHEVYSLNNNGVGLPNNNPNLKSEWIKTAEKYKKDIIAEKIKVPHYSKTK